MQTIDIKYNEANETVKYKFLEKLGNSENGKDPKTVRQYALAIHEFEVVMGFKDFKKYNSDWAITWMKYLRKNNPSWYQHPCYLMATRKRM